MNRRIVVHRQALEDLDAAYLRVANYAPQTALRWMHRLKTALGTLEQNAERCPVAPESRKVKVVIREFLFGRRPNVFRVVFAIDGECVRILRIRRGQRRLLSRIDIENAIDDG